MRILIASDAWSPQVNGVVTTLKATRAELESRGHEVAMLTPDLFRSMPCPTYPEIRLALARPAAIARHIEDFRPDAIHIATEGPIGIVARRWCKRRGIAFTTAYHTQFPDYVAARTPLPASLVWRFVRRFHAPARHVLASTPSIRAELAEQGIGHVAHWGRGVDLSLFRPEGEVHPAFAGLAGPILLSVGRVAVEKNLSAFLDCDVPGTKVVVGDGPARAELEARHPDTLFLGKLSGEPLAAAYRGADVFVFPSRTDTFGLVMIEAMACGTPVAAYPVTGPFDIVCEQSGALDGDLTAAIRRALACDRQAVARIGSRHSWSTATDQFVAALATIAE